MSKITDVLEPILNVEEVVALEQQLDAKGTSLRELMEHAGEAIVACMQDIAGASARNVVVFAGSGNNGGDGWVAARLLAKAGGKVSIVTKRPADEIDAQPAHDAACETMEALQEEGLQISVLVDPARAQLAELLEETDAIVDAVLGTGFSGDEVREPYGMWIELTNEARERGTWVFAADAPSGLSAQAGTAAEPTIKADVTVTMLAAKPGLLVDAAQPYVGRVFLAPLVEG